MSALPSELKIGIIGGGQLGKMLIEASRPWNTVNIVLENDPKCPASAVAEKVIAGSLTDPDAIRSLAAECDVLTYEIEHIHADVLVELEAEGKVIIPPPGILKMIQDKGAQKEFYRTHEIPTAPYQLIAKGSAFSPELLGTFSGDRIVVKSRTGGYDGKGVQILQKADLINREAELDCVLEAFIADVTEISVIVASGQNGQVITYEPVEMYFNPVSNLVEFLFSPANISAEISNRCRDVALKAIQAFDGPGLFAVELFVTKEGAVLVNEIAPRPHNSGHHTIEGSYTSQFEQLNRILLNLPLGEPTMICPSAMINLVGPEGLSGKYILSNTENLLEIPGVYIHLYNKSEIKPHRKMGHITIVAADFEQLHRKADTVKSLLGFKSR